jgi:hypothetical protein
MFSILPKANPMNNSIDQKAIAELRAMARVYFEHGHQDKAEQMLNLAKLMESRIERDNQVVDIDAYRHDSKQQQDA